MRMGPSRSEQPDEQMGGTSLATEAEGQTGNGHSGPTKGARDNTWNAQPLPFRLDSNQQNQNWKHTSQHFQKTLIKPIVLLAGCPRWLYMTRFMGAGTTAYVSKKLGRHFLGSELNPEYINICNERINSISDSLFLLGTPQ